MAISTNQKPTIYRNLYDNTGGTQCVSVCMYTVYTHVYLPRYDGEPTQQTR